MTAVHPLPVATLAEQVRELVDRDGDLPSRNRVMKEFRVGALKANQALAMLNGHAAAEPTTNPDTPPVEPGTEPGSAPGSAPVRRIRSWPLALLALPAFVAIWSGWVGLGELTGFGTIHPLPGIADSLTINTAITLPIGLETYAAYALNVWLNGHHLTQRARRFAQCSALGSLLLGALGQVTYHLMSAAGFTTAPWPVTALVACLPVAVLGSGAALHHLVRASQ